MTETLAKKINSRISKINEALPDLNHGGCSVFACYFAEKMIAAGFDAKVIELSWDCWAHSSTTLERFKANNINMHTAKEKHISPDDLNVKGDSHYCVKIGTYYFDSEVFCQKVGNTVNMYDGDTYNIVGEVALPDIEYISIENRGDGIWNRMYDSDDNSKVKSFIDKSLSFLTPKKAKK